MMYDDDERRLPALTITEEDRPATPKPAELPPQEVQNLINHLAREKEWDAARIEADLRHRNGTTVPVDTIRWILEGRGEQ